MQFFRPSPHARTGSSTPPIPHRTDLNQLLLQARQRPVFGGTSSFILGLRCIRIQLARTDACRLRSIWAYSAETQSHVGGLLARRGQGADQAAHRHQFRRHHRRGGRRRVRRRCVASSRGSGGISDLTYWSSPNSFQQEKDPCLIKISRS